MIDKFNSLFEVNQNDTVGSAVMKQMTKGFIQGTVFSAIGLGVAAITMKTLSERVEVEEEETIYTSKEEIHQMVDEIIEKADGED